MSAGASFGALMAAALLVIVGSLLARWQLLRVRTFDPDELAHLHGAWSISQGLLPYRDYFEHHTPALPFLLAPFFAVFNVETNVDDAIAFLFFARRCMWAASAATLVAFFLLARLWRDWRVAAVATALLAQTPLFVAKTTEVRPDVLSTLLLVTALAGVMASLRMTSRCWREAWLLLAGLLLGAGILCTQKLVFVVPGFAAAIVWCGTRSPKETGLATVRALGLHLLGVAIPFVLIAVYFFVHGALRPFVAYNVVWNATWRIRFWPFEFPLTIAAGDPLLVGAAGAGVVHMWRRFSGDEGTRGEDALLLFTCASAGAGLLLLPVAYLQYYLVFLPFGALFASSFVVETVDASRGPHRREATLAVVLIAGSLYPMIQLGAAFAATNAAQLDAIRYVQEHTQTSDTVFDEYSGYGVFRRHAYFFWFLHGEMRAMLEEAEYDRLLDALQRGLIRPALVLVTTNVRDRSPAWREFLEAHYEPVGIDPIWRRRTAAAAADGADAHPRLNRRDGL